MKNDENWWKNDENTIKNTLISSLFKKYSNFIPVPLMRRRAGKFTGQLIKRAATMIWALRFECRFVWEKVVPFVISSIFKNWWKLMKIMKYTIVSADFDSGTMSPRTVRVALVLIQIPNFFVLHVQALKDKLWRKSNHCSGEVVLGRRNWWKLMNCLSARNWWNRLLNSSPLIYVWKWNNHVNKRRRVFFMYWIIIFVTPNRLDSEAVFDKFSV